MADNKFVILLNPFNSTSMRLFRFPWSKQRSALVRVLGKPPLLDWTELALIRCLALHGLVRSLILIEWIISTVIAITCVREHIGRSIELLFYGFLRNSEIDVFLCRLVALCQPISGWVDFSSILRYLSLFIFE